MTEIVIESQTTRYTNIWKDIIKAKLNAFKVMRSKNLYKIKLNIILKNKHKNNSVYLIFVCLCVLKCLVF